MVARTGQITAQALLWCAVLFSPAVSTEKAVTQPPARAVRCAPERVFALPLRDGAIVAWVLPKACHEAASITGYTISTFDGEGAVVAASTSQVPEAGAVVRNLAHGHCYTFSVHARNAVGSGPESERSEAICVPGAGADVELIMTAPVSSAPGEELTFTMTVINHGAADAATVTVVDTLPAPLANFSTTQGLCRGTVGGTDFSCNLGALATGATAIVTVTVVTGNTSLTNTAWATAFDSAGTVLPDRAPVNNLGTATVSVQASPQN